MDVGSRKTTRKECQIRRNTGAGTTTGLEVFLMPFDNESTLMMGQRDLNGARVRITFGNTRSQFISKEASIIYATC